MDAIIERVIKRYEESVREQNKTRHSLYGQLSIVILGQQGLLVRKAELSGLNLLATTDFDALLKGEPPLEDVFKRFLREEGISYDEESIYIWLPDETRYELLYESKEVKVESPYPIYLIVSKAVKAPRKNKQLVIDAISKYGDELLILMERYNVDPERFFDEDSDEQ